MKILQDTIKFLDDAADTLDAWARESQSGGWSTHQVAANRKLADDHRRKASELRKAVSTAPSLL